MPDFLEDSKIKKYRTENPQYNDIPDEDLLKAVHEAKYRDINYDDFQKAFLSVYKDPEPAPGVLRLAGKGLVSGLIGVAQDVGGAVDFLQGDREPGGLSKWGKEVQVGWEPPADTQPFSFDWFNYHIPRMAPGLASLLIPQVAGTRAFTALGQAAELAPRALELVSILGGAGTTSVVQSLAAAGNVYDEKLGQGATQEDAKSAASKVLAGDMVINTALNSIGLGKILKATKIPITQEVIRKSIGTIMGDIGVTSGIGGLAGFSQQIVSNVAMDRPWHEGIAESSVLGTIGGAVLGGATEILHNAGKLSPQKFTEAIDRTKTELGIKGVGEKVPPVEGAPPVEEPAVSQRAKDYAKVAESVDPTSMAGMIEQYENALTNNGTDKDRTAILKSERGQIDDDKKYLSFLLGTYGDLLSSQVKANTIQKVVGLDKPKNIGQDIADIVVSQIPEEGRAGLPRVVDHFDKRVQEIQNNPDLSPENKQSAIDLLNKNKGEYLIGKMEQSVGDKKGLVRQVVTMMASSMDQSPTEYITQHIQDVVVGGKFNPELLKKQVLLQSELLSASKLLANSPEFNEWKKDKAALLNPDSIDPLPLVLFHGTRKVFDELALGEGISDIGWHFGTLAAVQERISHARWDIPNIRPYVAKTNGLFRMPDVGFFRHARLVLDMLEIWATAGRDIPYNLSDIALWIKAQPGSHFNEWSYNEEMRNDPYLIENLHRARGMLHRARGMLHEGHVKIGNIEQNVFNDIRKIFESYGYDGIVYKNMAEDIGKDSYIFWNKDNVRPLFDFERTNHIKIDESILLQKPQEITQEDIGNSLAKGAMQLHENGKAIIHLFDNADFSTFSHEMFHVAERFLEPEQLHYMEKWVEKKYGDWNTPERERLARAWETYWLEGKAPNEELIGVFAKIKKVMMNIYKGIKSLVGESIPSGLAKSFDSMIDKESKLNLRSEVRNRLASEEVLGNNKHISGSRVIGSLENVKADEVQNTQARLKDIGYNSRVLPAADGTFEVSYFIKESPQVGQALELRARELMSQDLGINETKELGKLYGYSQSEIATYMEIWKSKLKAQKEAEKFYEGETYTSPVRDTNGREMAGRNIWQVQSRKDSNVTLNLVGGKLFEITGGTPQTITVPESDLTKYGFIQEQVKKPGLARGKGAESYQEKRKELLFGKSQYKDENPSDADIQKYVDENFGGDIIKFGVGQEFAKAQGKPQESIQSDLIDESGALQGKTQGPFQEKNFPNQLDPETYDLVKESNIEIQNAIKQAEAGGDTQTAQSLKIVLDEFNAGNKVVRDLIENDPDKQVPSDTPLSIPPEIRASHYDDLGLTKDQGDKLTDNQLEQMLERKYNGDDSILFQMSTQGLTEKQADDTKVIGKHILDRLTPGELKIQMKALGLTGSELGKARDKAYLMAGMPQVIARYQPNLFGRIFNQVNDNIRIANSIVTGQLETKDYLDFKKAPRASGEKVWNALTDGTRWKGEKYAGDKPIRPDFESWIPLKELANTLSDEELKIEKDRRAKLRSNWEASSSTYVKRSESEYEARGKVWTNEELISKYGMNEDEIKHYNTMRKIADVITDYWKKSAMAYGMTQQEADKAYRLKGFMPLDRGSGKWSLMYKDDTASEGFGFNRFDSLHKAEEARRSLIQKGLIDPSDPKSEVRTVEDNVYRYGKQLSLDTMIDLIEDSGIPAAEISKHTDIQKLVTELKKRTYAGSRMIRRGDVGLIVDPDTMTDVFETFVNRVAKRYARSITNAKVEGLVRSVPSDTIWSKYAREYVNMSFAPGQLDSKFWNQIRAGGFLRALAFNVSNAALNLTQPIMTTLPFLNEKTWRLSLGESSSAFLKAGQTAFALAFGKDIPIEIAKKYPGLRQALDEWKHKAVIAPSLAEELAKVKGGWGEVVHNLGALQFLSEKFNRVISATAGYMVSTDYLVKKSIGNPGLSLELARITDLSESQLHEIAMRIPYERRAKDYEAVINSFADRMNNGELTPSEVHRMATRFGERTSDTTQFVFGKHNYPKYITSAGWASNPLKSAFLFRGFMQNYVGFILTSFQKGRVTPTQMGALLLPLLALTGISGFPFTEDLKEILRSAGIADFDTTTRKLVKDQGVSDLILKGIPPLLWNNVAFDMSKRGGAGNVIPQGGAEAVGSAIKGDVKGTASGMGTFLLNLFGGAPEGMLLTTYDGVRDIFSGQTSVGARKILPVFAANLIKAIQYSQEGAISSRGNLQVPKEQTGGVLGFARTAVGFKPANVARNEDFEQAIRFSQAARMGRVEIFNTRLADAIRKNDPIEVQDVLQDIIHYNSKSDPSLRYNLKAEMAAIKRRVVLSKVENADLNLTTKQMRPEVKRLQDLYK